MVTRLIPGLYRAASSQFSSRIGLKGLAFRPTTMKVTSCMARVSEGHFPFWPKTSHYAWAPFRAGSPLCTLPFRGSPSIGEEQRPLPPPFLSIKYKSTLRVS